MTRGLIDATKVPKELTYIPDIQAERYLVHLVLKKGTPLHFVKDREAINTLLTGAFRGKLNPIPAPFLPPRIGPNQSTHIIAQGSKDTAIAMGFEKLPPEDFEFGVYRVESVELIRFDSTEAAQPNPKSRRTG